MRNSEQINTELQKVYEEKISELILTFNENIEGLSCPLIPHIFEDYVNAKNKILFLGKETHGWGELATYKHTPALNLIKILKDCYIDFDFARNIKNKNLFRRSAFWRFCYEIYSHLNDSILEKCEIKDFPRGFVWLNQARLDEKNHTPTKKHFKEILKWSYELLQKEIEILQPDTIILMGNNHYWANVEKVFKTNFEVNLDYEAIGEGKFKESVCIVKSSFFPKNIKVFWVRHPERKSNEEVFEMVEKIIKFS